LQAQSKDPSEAWLIYFSNLEGEEMEAIAMENPASGRCYRRGNVLEKRKRALANPTLLL